MKTTVQGSIKRHHTVADPERMTGGPTSPTSMPLGPLWGPLVRSFPNVPPPPIRIASMLFLKSV
jgi:hypothetical protein